MSSKRPIRILVADAYDAEGRNMAIDAGAQLGGILYRDSISHVAPDVEIDILMFDSTDKPVSIEAYDGIVWTGSNMTIHKPNDLMRDQVSLVQEGFAKGIPQHGSCWAIQLSTVAAGGACGRNPKGREFGISRDIRLTQAGENHPMMKGRPASFEALTTHSDMVTTLPEGATLLAENDFTAVQAMAINHDRGSFWSVQYHPEFDLHEMARLIDLRRNMLIKQGSFKNDSEADAFVAALDRLHELPGDPELAEAMGINAELQSRDKRLTELRNWLDAKVRPKMK